MALQRPQSRRCNGDNAGAAASDVVVLPNDDVLFEILLRIPARSLCRFRTVCRWWRSLLSDPQFAAAHAAHHRDDPLFVVCAEGGTYGHDAFAEIRLLDTSGRVVKRVNAGPQRTLLRQMCPHLDLVLLREAIGSGVYVKDHALKVLDTATGAVSFLSNNDKDDYCSFVFGRAVSSTGGYGKYKVLGFDTLARPKQPYEVLTVDDSAGTWRAAPSPPVSIKAFGIGTGVAIKGVVYHVVNNASWSIAAFDLEVEHWWPSLIQGPESVPTIIDGYLRQWRNLAEMNGRLAAVSKTSSTMEIWLLMCSGNWSKQCRVHIESFQFHQPNMCSGNSSPLDAKPLWVLDDGRVAFWVCSPYIRGTAGLWMNDPKTEMCTHVATTEKCINVGVGVYTGNLLQQLQSDHGLGKL
ncbi:unnamed protein product [Urochloa humidicola]